MHSGVQKWRPIAHVTTSVVGALAFSWLLGGILGWGVALAADQMQVSDARAPVCSWCENVAGNLDLDEQPFAWSPQDELAEESSIEAMQGSCPCCSDSLSADPEWSRRPSPVNDFDV